MTEEGEAFWVLHKRAEVFQYLRSYFGFVMYHVTCVSQSILPFVLSSQTALVLSAGAMPGPLSLRLLRDF